MTLDLTTIAPAARAVLIADGMRFGSDDTLEQANQTLNAYALHGAKLVDYGFGAADAQDLQDVRDALIAAGVGRETKRTSKKVDTAALHAAMREAQGVRLRARSVLNGAQRILLLAGKTDEAQKITVLLERESVAAADAEGLAKQMDVLREALLDPTITNAAKDRGGAKAIADLQSNANELRDAAKVKAEPRGTPVETETLDLIDGLIVSLSRAAREAAEAAARDLSEPAIVTAFELTALYKRRAKKAVDDSEG